MKPLSSSTFLILYKGVVCFKRYFYRLAMQSHLTFKTGDSFTFTIEFQNNLAESGLLHHDLVFIFSLDSKSSTPMFVICHTEIFAFFVKKSDFDTVQLDFNAASFYPSSLRNVFAQRPQEVYTDSKAPVALQDPHGNC